MRVALISDLHANEVALEAVLHDIDEIGIDELVCLGDVATLGPRPHAILQRLRVLGCRCILGNHDAFMLDEKLIHTYTEVPIVVEAVEWCRAQLSQKELDFIATFESTLEMALDDQTSLLLFHGTPRSHMEELLATTPPEKVDEMLAGNRATVLAGGHTHLQMLRQHKGMLIVNPGSVGMPFREQVQGRAPTILDHAEYAVVSASRGVVNVDLRRIALDRTALRAAAAASDNPLCVELEREYA